MALVGRRDGRNFGYGRQLSYAGPQALCDLFGGGHYGTVKAHSDRWLAFANVQNYRCPHSIKCGHL